VLAAVTLAKEKYGVATLIPYIGPHLGGNDYLKGMGFTDDEIIRRLREGGATVVDVSVTKDGCTDELCIKGDGHPTPLANRLRASIIKDYIEHHVPGTLVADLQ
jgi:hypothetical protein